MGSSSAQPFANDNDYHSTEPQKEGEEAPCTSSANSKAGSPSVCKGCGLLNSSPDSVSHDKRRREEDSDSDSDFYGFAADSFVFQEVPAFEDCERLSSAVKPIRKSNRRTKKRRKEEYVYY